MKCIILAGGSGDTLWPLSRKNYPKQFMNIKDGRSMLQETVVRNMPFCDEFLIVTNENYRNIVNGQMKVFQSLKYRLFMESTPKGTAAAIVLATLFCNQSELAFVVTSDHIIESNEYKETILHAKDLAKEGCFVAIGIEPKNFMDYDLIVASGDKICRFIERKDYCHAVLDTAKNNYLWNSGMYVYKAGDFINYVKEYEKDLYNTCLQAKREVSAIRRGVTFNEYVMRDIPIRSIETIFYKNLEYIKVVKGEFIWKDIGNVADLSEANALSHTENVIYNNCDNTTIINSAERQLVVSNGLKNMVIVNTEDAVYVSSRENVDAIKDIICENKEKYSSYFDYNRLSYREWGIHELLTQEEGYKVKKVTVFPGMSMNLHQHEMRSEHWSVVEGTATITLGLETKDYHKYECVFVPIGTMHKVANKTDKNVVIIEVGIGETVLESDLVKIYNDRSSEFNYVVDINSPIVKLDPAFKDYLWGGTKLRTVFGKKCDYDIIAESWELSAHPDGQSRIASGRHRGMLFNDYLSIIGKDALGWKCQAQDRFPILIKFIDAKQSLSIQIHPDDEYALENENEYGKNEMWYVVDCEPDSYLYCGLSKDTDKEEIEQRIADNTITEILNKIEVKKGDIVMVKAGTIHAIGAGIIICEIQQNSNNTYRMYDYDRRDKYGNTRELNITKALDVVDTKAYIKDSTCEMIIENTPDYIKELLVQCKYFECFKYEVKNEVKIMVDESSFLSFVFIEGDGFIKLHDSDETMEFRAGDSFFVSAGKRVVVIKGQSTCIMTHV